jgi:hypothetical protein
MMYHQRMRTTVDLPDHLLIAAKKLAAERRMSLTRVFEESVRCYLSEQRMRGVEEPAPLPVLRDPAPVPGVDLDDTSRLWEIE